MVSRDLYMLVLVVFSEDKLSMDTMHPQRRRPLQGHAIAFQNGATVDVLCHGRKTGKQNQSNCRKEGCHCREGSSLCTEICCDNGMRCCIRSSRECKGWKKSWMASLQSSISTNGVEVGKNCENNSAKSCVVYNPSMPIPYCSCTGANQHVTDGKWRLAVSLLCYNDVNVSITYES